MIISADSVLARTYEGTRRMNARPPDLGPGMRRSLSLCDGRETYRELLENAGIRRGSVGAQLELLLEKGLIEVTGWDEAKPAPAPARRSTGLPLVCAAKLQLLKRFEALGGTNAPLLAEPLLSARTLRELAERAQGVAIDMQSAVGSNAAHAFWDSAKAILLEWRARAAQGA